MNTYGRWMESWERSLTLKDKNRQIFPFSWGLDWIHSNGTRSGSPLVVLRDYAERALQESEEFFASPQSARIQKDGYRIRFTSPSPGSFLENNTVEARIFEAKDPRRAVIVVPQWNADSGSHVNLCRVFSALGLTAVRLTLPYHEKRAPGGMKRADLMVSPNIGRTVHAVRQAVLEVRQLARWLKEVGYEHVGVMGTSLGSCVAYLAFTHDPLIETGVFNHVSSYFADVVWRGLSTRYVFWGLEGHIELRDLRKCWAPLSPWYFIDRLKDQPRPHLMITAKYDLTFLPELSQVVFDRYRELKLEVDQVELPCGHYTTAHFPFNVLDAWHICRYLRDHLGIPANGEGS